MELSDKGNIGLGLNGNLNSKVTETKQDLASFLPKGLPVNTQDVSKLQKDLSSSAILSPKLSKNLQQIASKTEIPEKAFKGDLAGHSKEEGKHPAAVGSQVKNNIGGLGKEQKNIAHEISQGSFFGSNKSLGTQLGVPLGTQLESLLENLESQSENRRGSLSATDIVQNLGKNLSPVSGAEKSKKEGSKGVSLGSSKNPEKAEGKLAQENISSLSSSVPLEAQIPIQQIYVPGTEKAFPAQELRQAIVQQVTQLMVTSAASEVQAVCLQVNHPQLKNVDIVIKKTGPDSLQVQFICKSEESMQLLTSKPHENALPPALNLKNELQENLQQFKQIQVQVGDLKQFNDSQDPRQRGKNVIEYNELTEE